MKRLHQLSAPGRVWREGLLITWLCFANNLLRFANSSLIDLLNLCT